MRAVRSILPLGLVLASSFAAAAAPVVEGAPRWSTSGPGLSGQGSSAILQADVDSTAQDTPLASVMRDGLAPASLPLVTLGAEVIGVTSRVVSFGPSGWSESLDLGSGSTLSARDFAFARNVFAYRLTLDGAVSLPLNRSRVRARAAAARNSRKHLHGGRGRCESSGGASGQAQGSRGPTR